MNEYLIRERKIPLDDSKEVIILGGGPAGCAAATAAAREGAKTLLVEATGMLGGMGTAGLVPWFCGYSNGKTVIARGLASHVRNQLRDNMPHLRKAMEEDPEAAPAIDPELLKRIYDEMVVESGADILFNSSVCAVEKDAGGGVDAVIISNKSGLTAYRAKIYIDCTGDGDIAAWAGAPFEKGDISGAMQMATHCFVISNVDESLLAKGPEIHFYDPNSPVWKALKSDKYPLINDLHSCNMKIGPATFGFNAGHIPDVDNTEPWDTSRALITGRSTAGQYRDAFAEYHPAFANSVLVATGSLMGIRETRRVLGDYVLTVDDYTGKRKFHDEICRNAYGIDVHNPSKENQAPDDKSIQEIIDSLKERNRKAVKPLNPGDSFGVPYRCLTPKNLKNVLVGGRCISTDRQVNGSVRIMACCLNTGEAAGVAGAMACFDGGDVHSVDTDKLREKLKSYGAYLPDAGE